MSSDQQRTTTALLLEGKAVVNKLCMPLVTRLMALTCKRASGVSWHAPEHACSAALLGFVSFGGCAAHLNEGLGVVALEALVDDPEPGAGAGPPVGRLPQRKVVDHQAALAAHALHQSRTTLPTLPGLLDANKEVSGTRPM